jgi:hypothetical protein
LQYLEGASNVTMFWQFEAMVVHSIRWLDTDGLESEVVSGAGLSVDLS